MLTIRTAELPDYPIIQDIANRTWPVTFQAILSGEQIAYMLDMMYSPAALMAQMQEQDHVFLLVQDAGGYLGYVSYELGYKGSAKTKIHKIYILPEAQGRGIGRLLIARVAEIAGQHANNALTLNVNRDNVAVQVYEKLGFVISGQQDIAIGNGFVMQDYVMQKSLR